MSRFGLSRAQTIGLLIMVALIVIAPAFQYPVFLMKVMCFALFACAFNLLLGYAGLLSFGHAAFFGIGSYATAYAARNFGVSAEIGVALGMLAGAALGFAVGFLAIRRLGLAFAMITLALAQMVYFFCLEASGFTGGEDGIQQVPRPPLLGVIPLNNDIAMYALVSVVFLAGFLLVFRIVHSPFGQVLKSIRENEPRATSLGYRTNDYKLIAFVLSAAIAGGAGGLKSLVFGIASLTDVASPTSGEVILMTLLGGLATVFGPVLGAVVIVTLEQKLSSFGSWVTVTQGVVFIVCVLVFRRGIVGELGARLKLSL